MKLWEKGGRLNSAVERFTTGKDREMDLLLARHDVTGSMAHAYMLGKKGILNPDETEKILRVLAEIYKSIQTGEFLIPDEAEDVHSRVEGLLIASLGETGKKIHTGRSRNDQVLLDIRLYTREHLQEIVSGVRLLFDKLLDMSEKYRDVFMPGYTHMQVAMPSTFGLWLGSFAESLADDMLLLETALRVNDQNPLGTAAGYGSPFPVDRELTTRLLGFPQMCVNSVYAQSSRGKAEWVVSSALASLGHTLGKMATDICLFMGQDFGFLLLRDDYTTGSSIMPHKKNPDVFELIRADANRMKSLPSVVSQIISNLPTGYHRDYQIIKELYLPALARMEDVLQVCTLALGGLKVNSRLMEEDRYRACYSVEEVNNLVRKGVPFREAYLQVAGQIGSGTFRPGPGTPHTHTGSTGNPGTELIRDKMDAICGRMDFEPSRRAVSSLLRNAGVTE